MYSSSQVYVEGCGGGEGLVMEQATVHGNPEAKTEVALQVIKTFDNRQDHPTYKYPFETGSFAVIPCEFCKML